MDRPKFIVDNNVGKLSVWLRALGYDTAFINPIDDGDLVRLALNEGRIVLTKDTGILKRRLITSGEVRCLFIHAKAFDQQLLEVIRSASLDQSEKFTRCLACNQLVKPCPPEEARQNVAPHVAQSFTEYWQCPACCRYYWQGSHWQRMEGVLQSLFAGELPDH